LKRKLFFRWKTHEWTFLCEQLSLGKGYPLEKWGAQVMIQLNILTLPLYPLLAGPRSEAVCKPSLSVGRAPFHLLRLYSGPAVLLTLNLNSWYVMRTVVGASLTLPLSLWSTVPGCRRDLHHSRIAVAAETF
jgi:hypothetical protein